MFVAVLAIVMIIFSVMDFDPKVEKWSSLFAGGCAGFLIVKTPAIITYFKNRRQKSSK